MSPKTRRNPQKAKGGRQKAKGKKPKGKKPGSTPTTPPNPTRPGTSRAEPPTKFGVVYVKFCKKKNGMPTKVTM
jgi:hypothetical protein